MRKFVVSALLCLPLLAHADCKDGLPALAQKLHPGHSLNVDAATCKVSPADPAQTFVVLPTAQPDKADADGDAVYDVDVLVVDSSSGAIIAQLFEPGAISSDAVRLDGIDLDTARYQLAPQTRAFGVRTNYEGSSRVNPFSITALDLFVVDGHTLRRVVSNLIVKNGSGEWDGNCEGAFSDISRTLSIGSAAHEGYATLHLVEKKVDRTSKPAGDQCVDKTKPATQAGYDFSYDGKRYVLPKNLRWE